MQALHFEAGIRGSVVIFALVGIFNECVAAAASRIVGVWRDGPAVTIGGGNEGKATFLLPIPYLAGLGMLFSVVLAISDGRANLR